jgi:hypothetical protein
MTDKELVRLVAKSDGFHLPPAYYRHEVKKRFDRQVTPATVTKSIGAYRTRLTLPEKVLVRKAKDLLMACHHDQSLAKAMVGKAAVS